MNDEDRRYLSTAKGRIEQLLASQPAEPLRPGRLSPELQAFAEVFDRLLEQLAAMQRLAVSLANGDLSHEPPPRQHLLDPLKQLQGNLRHLTWQAEQIAAGDLDQRVDFLGDFSAAFNQMIEGLREKRIAEQHVRYLSQHDALTGLYNRAFFNEAKQRLSSAEDFPVSLLIADVDGLKRVNDHHGHSAGDFLIQKAGRVLEHAVRVEDAVVRLGGDEFVIILHRTDAAEAQAIIARIREALGEYNRRDPTPFLSLSLGAATAATPAALEEALRLADDAMYRDKRTGKQRGSTVALQDRRVP